MSSLKGARVLVVDDEPLLRDMLREEFESEGSKVYEAPNGTDAFAISSSQSPQVVVSDIRMMGGDGVALLKNLRGQDSSKPVVVLITGFSDYGADLIYSLGANSVISKPYDFFNVRDTVNRLLVPEVDRWKVPYVGPVEGELSCTFESYEGAKTAGQISIGGGGLFLAESSRLPVNSLLKFNIKFASGQPAELRGVAALRWRRDSDSAELPMGVGLEFISLDPSTLKFVMGEKAAGYVETAFIPRL